MADTSKMFGGQGTLFGGAGPITPLPTFNVAQQFGLSGGTADLVNSLVQGIVPQLFGAPGMQFGQFSPQINLYDQFRQRSAFQMQMQAVNDASKLDQNSYEQVFRGFANLTGTPFGLRERAAAGSLAKDLSAFMPLLTQAAPDLADRLYGSRGSAAVMAQRMAMGSRYMADPLSGNVGMTGSSLKAITERVFESLYGEKANVQEMRGITAGQSGAMFDEMARRGLISSAPKTLTELSKNTGKTVDELMNMKDFNTNVQQFEANRIVDKLKSMSGAVAAMKDIFGENGRPDAPMSEIFNALQKITQNNLSSMAPGQVERLVRNASNAARISGMGLEGMMANIAAAGQSADRLGLDRSFAPGIATNSALFASAYSSVFGNARGFGLMDKERAMGIGRELNAAAIASTPANSLAALMRLADSGAIDLKDPKNAEVASYINRIRAGEPVEYKSSVDLQNLASKAGVTGSLFQSFARQQTTNQATISKYNLGEIAAKGQSVQTAGVVQTAYSSVLASLAGGNEKATQAMMAVVSRRLINANETEFNDFAQGNQDFMLDELEAEYSKATGGKKLDRTKARIALSRGMGIFDEVARRGNFGSAKNLIGATNAKMRDQIEQNKQLMQSESNMQSKLATLNRVGPMQRLTDALMGATPDKPFGELMREVFGGITDEQLRSATGGEKGLDDIIKRGRELSDRPTMRDAGIISKYLSGTALTDKENVEFEKIKKVYGIGDDFKQFKGRDGKPLSEQNILTKLTTSKYNIQAGLLSNMDVAVKNLNLDLAGSAISQSQITAVRNAAQSRSANAGTMAQSLADAIVSDTGAMSTMTAEKAEALTKGIRESGAFAEELANSTLSAEAQRKLAGDGSIAAMRDNLNPYLNAVTSVAKKLSDAAKESGVSVEELRANITATDADRNELRDNGVMAELEAARQELAAAGNDPVKLKAAQDRYNRVARKVRAHAQRKGYSADSILDPNFVSKIKGGPGAIQKIRDMFNYRGAVTKGLNEQLQYMKDKAKEKGVNLIDVVGEGLSAPLKEALGESITQQTAEFSALSKAGNVVLSDEEKTKLESRIKRQSQIVESPGEALKKLLDGIGGGAAVGVTQDITDQMNKAGAGTKASLARNLASLEQLVGKNEASGQLGIDLGKIRKLAGGELDINAETPEVRNLIQSMDKSFRADLAKGDFSGTVKNLEQERKAKEEKEAADKAPMFRLAPGTFFDAQISYSTGQGRFTVPQST